MSSGILFASFGLSARTASTITTFRSEIVRTTWSPSRSKSVRCAARAASRSTLRNGPVSSAPETAPSSSGCALTSSSGPTFTICSTIGSARASLTGASRSDSEAVCEKRSASKTSSRAYRAMPPPTSRAAPAITSASESLLLASVLILLLRA